MELIEPTFSDFIAMFLIISKIYLSLSELTLLLVVQQLASLVHSSILLL